MAKTEVKPYGSWRSPISSDLIVSETVPLSEIQLDGEDIYWLESRPSEGGRSVIVHRSPDGTVTDVVPQPWNVRTRVHEYGGGSYLVHDKKVYFSNFTDQRLYQIEIGQEPQPITPGGPGRYADGVFDTKRNHIICVREDHSSSKSEPVNEIVSIDLDDGEIRVLVSGNDFYASPRLSPNGSKLTWVAWDHPNMPWDATELWLSQCQEDGSLDHAKLVAGGNDEAIIQPKWSPDGSLTFASDRTNWWNLYMQNKTDTRPLHDKQAEFGLAMSSLGSSAYDFISNDKILCSYTQEGEWSLAILNIATNEWTPIDCLYTHLSNVKVANNHAVFIGGSPTEPVTVVKLDLLTLEFEILRRSFTVTVDEGYLSVPETIEFPTEDQLTAFGFYYPPKNIDYHAPNDEQPPLIVSSHGGPTSATTSTMKLGVQYWTSRGFAVLDVNYGGSTGYGRAYRQRLNDKWGIVDVDDCVNGARYLVDQGKVDAGRTAITGGSAGGYTTLAALTFRDFFKAGSSHFGVSDLELLAKETHKYESRYLDGLIGAYPEKQDIYYERSPVHFANQLSSPVIFFQGTEDKVVLPNQAEVMAEALREKGVPVALVMFEGEGHGFRQAKNIKRTMESELYFYSKVFEFDIDGSIEPINIENLSD